MSVHELNRLILNPVLSIVSPLPVYNPSKMAVNWLCETNRIHIYSLWYFIQIYYHTISHLQNGLPLIMRIHISYNSLWYLYSDILFFQCFWLYYILPAVAVIPDIESTPLSSDTASYTCQAIQHLEFEEEHTTSHTYIFNMSLSHVEIQAFNIEHGKLSPGNATI
jgi:hypothetical protein